MSKGIAIKPNHFKQYKDIAFLLMKFGQLPGAGVVKFWQRKKTARTSTDLHIPGENSGNDPDLHNLVAEIESMGPTFVRLGQLLSLRPNFLPLPYLDAFSRLGKNCAPFDFEAVKVTVQEDLGRKFSDVFASFDEIPVAVSVLEQTHFAVLRPNTRVVVKVQRPGVREELVDDLQAFNEVASLFNRYAPGFEEFDFREALQVFRRTMIAQLDYRQEAQNLKTLCHHLRHLDLIEVPKAIETVSSSRVLTLSYINGAKLPESPLLVGLLRSERTRLSEQIFHAYMQQFLVDGFVHADPDPENMFLTKDGKIAIMDVGVVDRIAPAMQAKLIQLLLSINEGRSEQAAEQLVSLCTKGRTFNESGFRKSISDLILTHRDRIAGQNQIGHLFRGIVQVSAKSGATLPWELSELSSALVKLDEVAHILDPRFDSNQFVSKIVTQVMQKHMTSALSPAHIFHTVVETSEFVETLPSKVSKILESIANNDLKMTVHAIDEHVLIDGFQKIANRITVGLILAALIMGAALLMRIETSFKLFGYPGLAIVCFMAAAGCGFFLILEVLIGDRKKKV